MTGPYGNAARAYRDAGWQGVLPIVGKRVPPSGFTGLSGAWPDDVQVEQWIATRSSENIGLRMPDDVIGIDVDAYDGRRGLETIEWYELQLDETLPPTWTASSRTDGSGSGIRFFRVPEGVSWRSDLGKDSNVEILRYGHRFAVVWPSVHPDTGQTYRWKTPDGNVSDDVPAVGEFPALSQAWVDALTNTGGTQTRHSDNAAVDEDVARDAQGNKVDVERILNHGIPDGEQNAELYRYMCSLRARYAYKSEMIALGMIVLQKMPNDPSKAPWTPDDIVNMVERVRRQLPAGPSLGMANVIGPAAMAWAASVGDVGGRQRTHVVEERMTLATDLGNSLRVTRVLGDRLRYAADEGRWYVWDELRWAPDKTNRALDLTKLVLDDIRLEAANAEGDDRARWNNWARDSESIQRRRAMLSGAEAEPGIVITTEQLDANPDVLVVRNGTLDLKTGLLRESNREDLSARLAEVTYDKDAQCPRWLGHIDLLCNGDPVLAAYMRRAVGYTLTGQVGARSFFFMEGTGSNGKNAFIEPIMMMLGSYAQTATTALLTGGDEQHPTILADLLGTRLVFIDETKQGKALNVERVKALTGSKRVKARRMRQDFFEFDAQFKLWIAGNGQPTIRDSSDGVWNRMHRILCKGKVAPGQQIDRFGDLLYAEEASGILNWALEGLMDWRQLGSLGVPATIKEDVKSYQDEENSTAQYVEDILIRTDNPEDFIPSADIYLYYQSWASAHGLRGQDLKNAIHFSRDLVSLGLISDRPTINGKKVRGFRGVRWSAVTAN